MTTKVLEFKLEEDGKKYRSDGMRFCGDETREYFDVDKAFDLHCSTEPPRHDEYYILCPTETWMWVFFNGPEKQESPWPRWSDTWLGRNFGGEKKVYIWAMG